MKKIIIVFLLCFISFTVRSQTLNIESLKFHRATSMTIIDEWLTRNGFEIAGTSNKTDSTVAIDVWKLERTGEYFVLYESNPLRICYEVSSKEYHDSLINQMSKAGLSHFKTVSEDNNVKRTYLGNGMAIVVRTFIAKKPVTYSFWLYDVSDWIHLYGKEE